MRKFKYRITREFYDHPDIKKFSVDFILSDRRWNNNGYYSLYRLYATPSLIKTNDPLIVNTYIGDFCIMNIMDSESGYETLYNSTSPSHILEGGLPDLYVSMPTDVDSGRRLLQILSLEQRIKFLDEMNMILGEEENFHLAQSTKEGVAIFQKSFMCNTNWNEHKNNILIPFKDIILSSSSK